MYSTPNIPPQSVNMISSVEVNTGPIRKRFINKIAVVTGSTNGIGFHTAKRLAVEGAKVVICSRDKKIVDNAESDLRNLGLDVTGVVCHVGKKEDRANLLKEALTFKGTIDILISNAAANPAVGHVFDTPEEAWDKVFDINLKSAFMLSKEFLPYIAKGGSIVYISSIAGLLPMSFVSAYSVSKSALCSLTKAASYQCGTLGIRVNCVAPGLIKTEFSKGMWDDDEIRKRINSKIPLNRFGTAEEVAGVIAWRLYVRMMLRISPEKILSSLVECQQDCKRRVTIMASIFFQIIELINFVLGMIFYHSKHTYLYSEAHEE